MGEGERVLKTLRDTSLELLIYSVGLIVVGLVFVITLVAAVGPGAFVNFLRDNPTSFAIIGMGAILMILGTLMYSLSRNLQRAAEDVKALATQPRQAPEASVVSEEVLRPEDRELLERAVDYFIDEYGYDFSDEDVRRSYSIARKLYRKLLEKFEEKQAVVNAAATAVKIVAKEIKIVRLSDGRRVPSMIVSVPLTEDVMKAVFGAEAGGDELEDLDVKL